MADARNIVTWALQDLGVLAAGEIAVAADALDALSALNNVIDQLAAERLAIHRLTRTTCTIAASTASYTVGTGGTINVARPVFPLRASYFVTADDPDTEISLGESLTPDEWMRIPQKAAEAAAPTRFYYEPTMTATAGTGTLYLWPIPNVATLTGVLYAPQQVAEFTSLSTAVLLPPGYRRMLTKNLAVELGPSYGVPISADLRAQADDATRVVKRSNVRLNEVTFEGIFQAGGAGAAYQIETDQ